MLGNILSGLAGFSMLYFGVRFSISTLDDIHAKQLTPIINKLTNRGWLSFLLGVLVTLVVQASSITILLAMALVNRGVLPFYQACLIMLGATLGTSLKGFYIVGNSLYLAYILTFVALCLTFISKKRLHQKLCHWLFVVSFSLYGLHLLRNSLENVHLFQSLANSLDGTHVAKGTAVFSMLLTGAFATVLMQSSSAVILTVAESFSIGGETLAHGFAAILGANIGTTSTALLFSMGYHRDGRRLAVAHVCMKVIGVLVTFLFLKSFMAGVDMLGALLPTSVAHDKITLFNVTFNIVNALSWWLLLPILIKVTDLILKPAKHNALKFHNKQITQMLLQMPERGIKECRAELINAVVEGRDVLKKYRKAFFSTTPAEVDTVVAEEKLQFHEQVVAIKDVLEKIHLIQDLSQRDKIEAGQLLKCAAQADFTFMLMGRIGDELGTTIQGETDRQKISEQVDRFEDRFKKAWQSLYHELHRAEVSDHSATDDTGGQGQGRRFVDEQYLLGERALFLLSDGKTGQL